MGALAAASCRAAKSSPISKAVGFLWAQQGDDGGFHSQTYGLLRSGQSLTPLVLGSLLSVPDQAAAAPAGAIDRALEFIRRNTNAQGVLGQMDESADYPNYATALAVSVFVKAKRGDFQKDIAPMVAQLRAQQFSDANGWRITDPPYGGWGIGGDVRRPPEAGHVDLSMSRYVIEALSDAGVSATDPVMVRAQVYLNRSRNDDGGFYFSTVNEDTNKAGPKDGSFASYGTTTADGVLALRAAGVSETDKRMQGAIGWLRAHHRADRAPGFEVEPHLTWGTGLRFYYADVISRVARDFAIVLPEQNADGSFRNPNNLVKEDDPLIATSFALNALARR